MTITLTNILKQRALIRLIGARLTDLAPRGDLGLGLDPAGPVGFAQIRAFSVNDRATELHLPLIMSVYGDGDEPAAGDTLAAAGDRVWTVGQDDVTLALRVDRGSAAQLLRGAGVATIG